MGPVGTPPGLDGAHRVGEAIHHSCVPLFAVDVRMLGQGVDVGQVP